MICFLQVWEGLQLTAVDLTEITQTFIDKGEKNIVDDA